MSEHPLKFFGISINNYRCFGDVFQGWDQFSPINVAVGRNNSGKSALIDVLNFACSEGKSFKVERHGRANKMPELRIELPIPDNASDFLGNAERSNLENKRIVVSGQDQTQLKFVRFSALTPVNRNYNNQPLQNMAKQVRHSLPQLQVLKVAAERDIQPEMRDINLTLKGEGTGVTNLVRAFQNSDSLPSELLNGKLLNDLNLIYQDDCNFTEILCQESDNGDWEIFLQENKKGNIRLSDSGSSLKTVFIVLAFMILRPELKAFNWESLIFCVEEPENNLHPALLRRLLEYLANQREIHKFTLVITSHSPICIDWAAKREDAQIVHVQHDGDTSSVSVSLGYQDNRKIIDDLDFRASDILQANGIIWVEGPSDRIYLNKWIELASGGFIKERVHYSIMFYGGKLLYHLDALNPEQSNTLISLITMNKNLAILIDSDRKYQKDSDRKPAMQIGDTKRRVRDEVVEADGYAWITEGREVENYISNRQIRNLGDGTLRKVRQYDQIVKSPSLKGHKQDKVAFAHAYSLDALPEDLNVLDLKLKMENLVQRIRDWNGI